MCASGVNKCRWLVPDDDVQASSEHEPTFRELARRNLGMASTLQGDQRKDHALIGIGYALMANGEDAEIFYSLFAGPDGKANIEAWVENG